MGFGVGADVEDKAAAVRLWKLDLLGDRVGL